MTPGAFRSLILKFVDVEEGSHQGHPDFRTVGKVIATLGYPDIGWAMVRVSMEQQELLLDAKREIFKRAPGSWGLLGSTLMKLDGLDEVTALSAINMARSFARTSTRQ